MWDPPAIASLIDGPLASTTAYRAKVATSPREQTPNYQHVLCLYLPDVYDKDAVLEVRSLALLTFVKRGRR